MLRLILAAAVLLTASSARGEDLKLELPKWALTDVGGKTMACYDFEGGKKLKLFEHDAQATAEENAKLKKDVDDYEVSLELQTSAYDKMAGANETLQKVLEKAQTERDEALKKAAVAHSESVLGGGFPWLVVAATTGILVGAAGTYYLVTTTAAR